jgi:hypothetical protein
MRPRIYPKKRRAGKVLRRLLAALAILLIAAAVLFFLLRSWTEYDGEGAHIRFPWSQTAEAG